MAGCIDEMLYCAASAEQQIRFRPSCDDVGSGTWYLSSEPAEVYWSRNIPRTFSCRPWSVETGRLRFEPTLGAEVASCGVACERRQLSCNSWSARAASLVASSTSLSLLVAMVSNDMPLKSLLTGPVYDSGEEVMFSS